ncbi:MAG TPA: hypothetical protein VNL71_25205 [Chloroflexota bacterium]|nr:hypothetical protein [Chloroflexota bacterium]
MDPGASSSATEFAVAWGAADPLLGFPRHLPLIGRLAPQPRVSRWGPLANYRVQLRAAPGGSCGFLPCYEALLLDAAPQAGFRLGLM